MVLTGNPFVYRETDVITADKITFYTDDGRMVCEPQAKLILYPSKKQPQVQEQSNDYSTDEIDAVVTDTIQYLNQKTN